ncbi:MAG: FAD-dependent oxidoreductase [Oscillospiraceae bacterium]|nr:FAD-dependent oxidoreductase [Oscillospiraceae bacterium]
MKGKVTDMGNYDHVLSPLKVGNITIKNRIEFSPSCHSLASADGLVTREMIAYYKEVAKGGPGIVTIGESDINYEEAHGHLFDLNSGSPFLYNGLSNICEEVHRYGAKLSIELNHTGRHSLLEIDTIAPTPIHAITEELAAKTQGRHLTRITEMDQDMIYKTIEEWSNAAYNCQKAGLEMVMIHGGHGHLISQFLSPMTNKRVDRYGGVLENRAKYAIEVLDAVRARCPGLNIEYRISAEELTDDGLTVEDTLKFCRMIENKIDLLHVSVGSHNSWRSMCETIQPQYWPHNYLVHYAEIFKKELNIPITTVGSISTMDDAERIIAEGKADVVAMARALIADRQTINKIRRGAPEEVRPCIRCQYCNNRNKDFYPIRCTVDPTVGRELDYVKLPAAETKKKVVIIGGGPAGMQAGLIGAQRGHDVVLFERSDRLGGSLRYATGLNIKADLKRYFEWMVKKVSATPGLDIRLNTPAGPENVMAEKPDALIIAVGASPILPRVPGHDKPHVYWVGDVDEGRAEIGDTVCVVGGGASGGETALQLTKDGKKVTMIDMLPFSKITPTYPRGLAYLLDELGATLKGEVMMEEVTDEGVVVTDKNWKKQLIKADTVIMSLGFSPRNDEIEKFKDLITDVYYAGDCIKPANLTKANHDGFNIAVEL